MANGCHAVATPRAVEQPPKPLPPHNAIRFIGFPTSNYHEMGTMGGKNWRFIDWGS